MKATDLQIGDWVAIGSECFKHYGMVRSVDAANAYVISWVTKNTERHPICALDPIPLTPEILEKNGWLFNDLPMCQDWEKDGIFIRENDSIHRTIGMGINVSISVQYVHELQHALRLCGLEELADNFKID